MDKGKKIPKERVVGRSKHILQRCKNGAFGGKKRHKFLKMEV